jgi:hypothetical protein
MRLANDIFPSHFKAAMIIPAVISDIERGHHEFKRIEKREQPPAVV